MEKGLLVSGEWYNCGIWFYLPLKVARGDVHSRGGLGRRGILSPSSLWQICWLVFEVCDMVQLLFLLSNYKIIYHDIIFCTNQSNHYKASPLRVRYLQIYQQSHYAGLLIFRTVADPRNSGISTKSPEIPKKTRNTTKSARNIAKYMSAKHI